MTPAEVEALFTRSDGGFLFARWGRPIVPVVIGVEDATLAVFKGAIEAVAVLAGHTLAETDPELGANLMIFAFREWQELAETPNMDRLVPDLDALLARLEAADANQYRLFRFDPDGAIRAAFVFLRFDAALAEVPAETLALGQAVQTILLWSDTAFTETGPMAQIPDTGAVVLRPEIGDVIRAAYDPVIPAVSQDRTLALRLAARLGRAT